MIIYIFKGQKSFFWDKNKENTISLQAAESAPESGEC